MMCIDLPMLDCVGSQYPCGDHSYIHGNLIPRYVTAALSLAFTDSNSPPLALWMTCIAGNFIAADGIDSTRWSTNVTTTSLVVSMSLNALVTGLIVFKIFWVFQEVKSSTTTLDKNSLGASGGRQLRYVMFVIIESGMALFSIQLARVVSTGLRVGGTNSDLDAFNIIVSSHEMLNVSRKTTSSSFFNFFN